ncbi:MAG: betaine--homocysteine S-methyltransferase [Pseudomonadota bacterium]
MRQIIDNWYDGQLWYSGQAVLVADGAIGTGLFKRGLTSGDSPELWNIDKPDAVLDLHREFVQAGSDVILTNSFGGNRLRLKLHGLEARVGEFMRAGAALARRAADESVRECRVAGSIGPTGELVEPDGPLTTAEAYQVFREQAHALAEGGVDLIWIETMSSLSEIDAAIKAAAETGLPIVATMTFDTNAHTMMGIAPAKAWSHLRTADEQMIAVGANCGLGPADTLAACWRMTQDDQQSLPVPVLITKSNCGVPQYRDGQFHFSGTKELMRDHAELAIDMGVKIIGGCCGSDGPIIAAIRDAVDHHRAGPRPDLDRLQARLGEITPLAPAQGKTGERRRSRRRSAS